MAPAFSEVLDLFIQSRKVRGREPATLRSYRYFRDSFLVPALGEKPVDELHFRDLEALYAEMFEAGYATSSILKCNVTAGGALQFAVRQEWVANNAAYLVELPKHVHPKLDVPTPEQVARFLEFAWKYDRAVHDFARIGAASGLRPGENCALMVDDLDCTGTLTVSRALDVCEGAARLKGTKTGKTRRVSLDPETADIIRSRPGPFVHGGQAPSRTDLMSKRFRRVAIRADIPNLKARLLRHFHATQLLASGRLSVKQISERLGHANTIMLLETYAAYIPQLDVVAADVIGDVLPPIPSPRDW